MLDRSAVSTGKTTSTALLGSSWLAVVSRQLNTMVIALSLKMYAALGARAVVGAWMLSNILLSPKLKHVYWQQAFPSTVPVDCMLKLVGLLKPST